MQPPKQIYWQELSVNKNILFGSNLQATEVSFLRVRSYCSTMPSLQMVGTPVAGDAMACRRRRYERQLQNVRSKVGFANAVNRYNNKPHEIQ